MINEEKSTGQAEFEHAKRLYDRRTGNYSTLKELADQIGALISFMGKLMDYYESMEERHEDLAKLVYLAFLRLGVDLNTVEDDN